MHDLVPFVKFYKREIHPWRSVLKVTLLHGCFSRFLNCSDCTKLRNASHIIETNVILTQPGNVSNVMVLVLL